MATPTTSGWYAAVPGRGAARRGHVVLATLGADGFMLGRVEGEPMGPRMLTEPCFQGLEFQGPFESPDAALERLLEPRGEALSA